MKVSLKFDWDNEKAALIFRKHAVSFEGDQEMLDEYDFSNGIRGKYVSRFNKGSNIIVLDPDVAEIFTSSESVNNALRGIADIIRNEINRHNPAGERANGDFR